MPDNLCKAAFPMATSLKAIALTNIRPPEKFADLSVEEAFLREFRSAGRIFAASAFAAGTLMAGLTVIVLEAGWTYEVPDPASQFVRVFLIGCMLTTIYLLLWKPELSNRRYTLVVGVPMALCLIALGGIALWKSLTIVNLRTNLPTAHVISVLLAFCFTRLPVKTIALVSIAAATLIVVGMYLSEPTVVIVIVIYSVVSIAAGWIACIQIERRERALYGQSMSLLELGGRLSRKALEADRASNSNRELVRVVAHDLRQPIAGLALQIKRIEALVDSGRKLEKADVKLLNVCASYLQNGVDRLLADSSMQKDYLPLEVVDLVELVHELSILFQLKAIERQVELKIVKRRAVEIPAFTNRQALGDVLSNLIGNSIKFSRANTVVTARIVVALRGYSDRIQIDVLDNGVGMPAEQIPLAFEPYWRSPDSVSAGIGGLGMGLHIVRSLIDRLPGHSMRFDSVRGVGTRVRIQIRRFD